MDLVCRVPLHSSLQGHWEHEETPGSPKGTECFSVKRASVFPKMLCELLLKRHSLFFLHLVIYLPEEEPIYSGGCLEVGWLSVFQKWDAAHLSQNPLEIPGPHSCPTESRSPGWGLGSCLFIERVSNFYAFKCEGLFNMEIVVMAWKPAVLSSLMLLQLSRERSMAHHSWEKSSLNQRESHFLSS